MFSALSLLSSLHPPISNHTDAHGHHSPDTAQCSSFSSQLQMLSRGVRDTHNSSTASFTDHLSNLLRWHMSPQYPPTPSSALISCINESPSCTVTARVESVDTHLPSLAAVQMALQHSGNVVDVYKLLETRRMLEVSCNRVKRFNNYLNFQMRDIDWNTCG